MSVNDGLSDEEWGAWGKSEPTTTTKVENINNGITVKNSNGSDEDVAFNVKQNNFNDKPKNDLKNKFQENFNSDSNRRYPEKRGGYNGTRGNFNRFGGNNTENAHQGQVFNGNRDTRDYGKNESRFKDEERSTYRNNSGGYKQDNQDNRNSNNYKRDNSREKKTYNNVPKGYFRRDDSAENRTKYGRKVIESDTDDSREERKKHKHIKDKYRDDSRENRPKSKRDRSPENNYRHDRQDSREDRYNYRNDDRHRDDRESNNRRNPVQRGDFSPEDYRERRSSPRRKDYRRDNSWDDKYRKKDTRNDDSSDDQRKNRKYHSQRDDSRENRNGYKRDNSRDKRKPANRDREGYEREEPGNFRRHHKEFKKRYDSEDDGSLDKRANCRRDDDYEGVNRNLSDAMQSVNLQDNNKFSSNSFGKDSKPSESDKPQAEEPVMPKRACFIPNDDQADYELHVNSGINFDNYDKISVEVTGDNAPPPTNHFDDLKLPQFLLDNIASLSYKKLTPVQKYAIPIISSNRDLMACAQTGSGKTSAFLIPIITALQDSVDNIVSPSPVAFPKALIMAPTRELCRQIFTVARHLCRSSNIKCSYIYGGIEMNKSRRNIQALGCDILVATPGRLIHFLELVWVSLKHLKYFVLDEADRMLEAEGFYESVNKIYKEANGSIEDRTIQISMFSATFPSEIQTLARNLMQNYLFLAVGVVGSASSDVKQEVILAEQRDKINSAIDYIKTIPEQKTLIFVDTKRMADFFGIKLGYLGFKATTIHGDREQEQREIALNDFKSGRVNFMVATNVAARGLDIPLVDNVINIDMPGDIETYVHRIGRTGRCGNFGRAISFFDEVKDIGLASGLITKLQEANQEVPDWLTTLCDGTGVRKSGNNYSRDTRSDVKSNKYMDNPSDNFMKGTNIDYDDVKPTSEWLED